MVRAFFLKTPSGGNVDTVLTSLTQEGRDFACRPDLLPRTALDIVVSSISPTRPSRNRAATRLPSPWDRERARVRVAEMAVARRCESGNLYRPTNSFPAHRTTYRRERAARCLHQSEQERRDARECRAVRIQHPEVDHEDSFRTDDHGPCHRGGLRSDQRGTADLSARSGIGEGHAVALGGHGRGCPRRQPAWPGPESARSQGTQAPRSQDVQAPRGQDAQSPRSQDVQSPRSQDVQSPRGQDMQSPRSQDFQSPRSQDARNRRGVRTCSHHVARTCSRRDRRTSSHRAVRTFSRLAGRASSRAEAMTSRRLAAVRLRELRISRILLRQRRPGAS